MAKYQIALILSLSIALAKQLEISAASFYADEKKGQNTLSGDVIIKQDKDILRANKVIILTNSKRKPYKYIASGNARFEISLDDKNYRGRGEEFVYLVEADTYEINGKAYIEELQSGKKLYGDKISIDRKSKLYSVSSKQGAPARFVFDLDER